MPFHRREFVKRTRASIEKSKMRKYPEGFGSVEAKIEPFMKKRSTHWRSLAPSLEKMIDSFNEGHLAQHKSGSRATLP